MAVAVESNPASPRLLADFNCCLYAGFGIRCSDGVTGASGWEAERDIGFSSHPFWVNVTFLHTSILCQRYESSHLQLLLLLKPALLTNYAFYCLLVGFDWGKLGNASLSIANSTLWKVLIFKPTLHSPRIGLVWLSTASSSKPDGSFPRLSTP